jgi:threonine dehydratase
MFGGGPSGSRISVTSKSIRAAFERINPAFLNTPAFDGTSALRLRTAEVIFKDERQNPIRSFKGRGTDLLVQGLPNGSQLVCASAGNFGQGMAVAAARHGCVITVFAAESAVRSKVAQMRNLGANVALKGLDFDEAKEFAREYAQKIGAIFIEDGAHSETAAGAGTLALEITRDFGDFDGILIPLGNGALAAGVGAWFKQVQPNTKVVAVAAAQAPAMGRAVLGLGPPQLPATHTIADGIDIRIPIPASVEAVRRVVDDVMFVEEERIIDAVNLLEMTTGEKVEPAGAVGLAGFLENSRQWSGCRIAIPICGGNRDDGALRDQRAP